MNAYMAFFKKEACEMLRTHKLTILGLVFLLFGIMNPLAAKLLPELLATALPEGMVLTLPEPSAMDSWQQFFKNVSQMGIIVLVILFSGNMTNELIRGTLTHLLTKGLSRKAVILAKFAASALTWTFVYLLCFAVTDVYTVYFWPDGAAANLFAAIGGLWVFGLLLLSALLLGGVLFKNNFGCLLFTAALTALLYLLDILPSLQAYNPVLLSSGGMALLQGQSAPSDFIAPLLVSGGLILSFLTASILLFNRRAL